MEDRLRYVLSVVNEWLKFAEAKNGALLAVDVAIVFGILQLTSNASSRGWIPFAISLIGLSAISALLSFIPQLKVTSPKERKGDDKATSLIFYGHFAKYQPESYVKTMYSRVGIEAPSITPIELDFAQQIIINSRIALRKNRYFSAGLWLTVLGLVSFLVPLVISAVAVR